MKKILTAVIAGSAILGSAVVAMAEPATPGDDLYNYGPVNQSGFTGTIQRGRNAYGSAVQPQTFQRFAPALQQQPNAWDKARQDDASETGHG